MKEDKTKLAIKFVISAILDFVDLILSFTIFKIPLLGNVLAIFFEIVIMVFAVIIWGAIGIAQLWEVIDITDTVDAFIPTVTISGILATAYDRKKK